MIARLNTGGPAHQAALLSGRRFFSDRYETLLVHGSLASGEASMKDLAEAEGAQMHHLPWLGQPVRPSDDARALAELIRIGRRFRPRIVHTHTAKAGFLGRAAALTLRPRPRLVHTFHGHVLDGYFDPAKTRVYRALERGLARRSDVLIGVSEATVDDLVRFGVAPRERFRVIPVGLDLTRFTAVGPDTGAELRRELGLGQPGAEILLTYVGRIVPIKRLDLLLRSFAKARRRHSSLRLAIVGDGETRPEMGRLAGELGLAASVSFLGYRRDLPQIAAASDIAVLSSANEGTPVSLIEAGAASVPAVATRVGGVASVVTPETGILVEPDDANALAEAIVALATSPERRVRMGERARERMPRLFSSERLIDDIDALYRELLAGSREEGPAAPSAISPTDSARLR